MEKIKIENGASYTLIARSDPATGQQDHRWVGDNGHEIELTEDEAAELRRG
ncbi:hypothetical protein ACOKGD_04865 [Microbacterium phosphatis]|uniref:hypothetical protein n=1 Tax=Microbacterium phosphatis TaxID=3140248 RepID=UPI00313FFA8D